MPTFRNPYAKQKLLYKIYFLLDKNFLFNNINLFKFKFLIYLGNILKIHYRIIPILLVEGIILKKKIINDPTAPIIKWKKKFKIYAFP